MFSQDGGFYNRGYNEIRNQIRLAVNQEMGTSYTDVTFTDSNWDRIANILTQIILYSEQTMSAGWTNVQEYVENLNEMLAKPKNSLLGLQDYFLNELKIGCKIKQPDELEAGKTFLAFDLTNEEFENRKEEISNVLVNLGVLNNFFEGDKIWYYRLPNGQDWRYACKLAEHLPTWFKIDIVKSRNATVLAQSEKDVVNIFIEKLNERIKMGEDGEWDKILNTSDLPWTSSVNIGYKIQEAEPQYTYLPRPVLYFQKIVSSPENIVVNINELEVV